MKKRNETKTKKESKTISEAFKLSLGKFTLFSLSVLPSFYPHRHLSNSRLILITCCHALIFLDYPCVMSSPIQNSVTPYFIRVI